MLNTLGNVVDEKRQAELALMRSGLNYTIIRPGVFSKVSQGGMILGEGNAFTGADADAFLGPTVRCASPLMSSSGKFCAITRSQTAELTAAVVLKPAVYGRVIEVVARPEVESLSWRKQLDSVEFVRALGAASPA